MLEVVERRIGAELTLFQGSYNGGRVSASAGTHDGGGAVDCWCSDVDVDRLVRVMRTVGFAAWYRPAIAGLWGAHVHAIAIGDRELSSGARAQVVAYLNHRDGLKSNAHDPTWHPDPVRTFDYERAIDVRLDDRLSNGQTVGEALVAVLKMQQQLDTFRASERERFQRLRKRINDIARDDRVAVSELEALLREELSGDAEASAPASSTTKKGKS